MVFPIVAALGVASAVGGLLQQGAARKQRKAVAKSINEQIELAKEEYKVTQRIRDIEANESLFQFRRENREVRNQNRAQQAQLKVQTAASLLENTQAQLQNTLQQAQAKQQAIVKQQQAQQDRQAAASQAGEVNQQAAAAQQQIDEANTQAIVTGAARGQSTSRSTQAGLQRNQLFAEDVQAGANVAQGTILAQTEQDVDLNNRLTQLELQLQQSAINAQAGILGLQENVTRETQDANLEILRLQQKGFRQASRLGRGAELQRQELQRVSDEIGYESKVTGLKAQMPQSSGSSFGSILGGLANVGSQVYGLVQGMQTVSPTAQPLQTPQFSTAQVGAMPNSSLDSLFGVRSYVPQVPTSGLYTGGQVKASIFK
jgi:hypothetical protein